MHAACGVLLTHTLLLQFGLVLQAAQGTGRQAFGRAGRTVADAAGDGATGHQGGLHVAQLVKEQAELADLTGITPKHSSVQSLPAGDGLMLLQ